MIHSRASTIVFKEQKILMIHRMRNGEEYYVLPGGTVEESETFEVAALRELKEETSIIGKINKKISTFTDKEGRYHEFFLCTYVSGEPMLDASSPEMLAHSENNTYKPEWVNIDVLKNAYVWPEETKGIVNRLINIQ